MANCEDHWHSMEDKLILGSMVKIFEFLIMKIYSSQCRLLAEKSPVMDFSYIYEQFCSLHPYLVQ